MGTNINWKSFLSEIDSGKSILEENYSWELKIDENIIQENITQKNNRREFKY